MTEHLIEAYKLGIAEHWETESLMRWPLRYEVEVISGRDLDVFQL